MKSVKKNLYHTPQKKAIKEFIKQFPKDATSWANATGEIYDLHKSLADRYNEDGPEKLYKYPQDRSKTPAAYNTRYREGIENLLTLMNDQQIDDVFNEYKHWFENSKMEHGGRTVGDILIKDEGDFYNIYGETEKGKKWMKDNNYKDSQAISLDDLNYVRVAKGINVEEFENGGKAEDRNRIGINWNASDFDTAEMDTIDDDIHAHVADMVAHGYTSGILSGEEPDYSGSWKVSIEEDENDDDTRNEAVAESIRNGNTSGYDPTFTFSANVWKSSKNGGMIEGTANTFSEAKQKIAKAKNLSESEIRSAGHSEKFKQHLGSDAGKIISFYKRDRNEFIGSWDEKSHNLHIFEDGGKLGWKKLEEYRDKALVETDGGPVSFDEVESKMDFNVWKEYLISLPSINLPDNYEPTDYFQLHIKDEIGNKPFVGIKNKKAYYIDPQGYDYARYVGQLINFENEMSIEEKPFGIIEDGGSMATGGEIEQGDRVIITTKSLGKQYEGMTGEITSRKLLNNKYSIKLENGMTMAFEKGEFRHNSINPKYGNGGSMATGDEEKVSEEYKKSVVDEKKYATAIDNLWQEYNDWEKKRGLKKRDANERLYDATGEFGFPYKEGDRREYWNKDVVEFGSNPEKLTEDDVRYLRNFLEESRKLQDKWSESFSTSDTKINTRYLAETEKASMNDKGDGQWAVQWKTGGVTTKETSETKNNMDSQNWKEIWYIEGSGTGAISNISTSIEAAQKALASHNQHLVAKQGLGSMHKARVLKKDWDDDKINVSNLKKYQRSLAATGPLYQDGGSTDPEKKKIEDRIRALELALSSPSTPTEMRANFQKSLEKVKKQLDDYKPAPVSEYSGEERTTTERATSSRSGGAKVVIDIDPQSQLDNADKITVSVKAEGAKPEIRRAETKTETTKTEPKAESKTSTSSAPTSGGKFYIDIPDKYYGSIRNVLYQEKKEENIKDYKVKTFDNKNRVFLESQKDLDLIFKIYNERREKKGDPKVSKDDVTGNAPKMKHGGTTKRFSPVKKRVEKKSVKKSLSKGHRSIKGNL